MKPLNRIPILLIALTLVMSLLFGGIASASDLQQQATFQAPIVVVNASFLNVRTGPGVQYSILVTVVGGTELPILGVFHDRVWYQVNTDAGPGWVNVEFTLPRGDFSNVPLVDVGAVGAPNVAAFGQGGGGTVIASAVTNPNVTGYTLTGKDLHEGPSYDSLILSRSVPNDPSVVYPLLDARTITGATWYMVNVPGAGVGWVDHVNLRLLQCGSTVVGFLTSEQPINFDGIENRDSFLLAIGTEGYILGLAGSSNEFIRYQLLDGTVGFVPTFAVEHRTGIESVCSGVQATNLGQGGGGIDTTGGTRTTTPQISGNHVVVNTAFLNARSGPSAGYSVVATVPGGSELAVLGRASDNVWLLVQGDFGQAWVNINFTLFRGSYETIPLISEPIIISSGTVVNLGQGGGPPITTLNPSTVGSGIEVTGVSLIGRDMHEGPNYDSLIISRSVPNDLSKVYPLLATQEVAGTLWYFVSVPEVGAGWMDGVELRALECGSDEVRVVAESHPISFEGFSNRDTFLLPLGEEVYVLGVDGNNRFIVSLWDGSLGYITTIALTLRTGVTSYCNGVSSGVGSQTAGTNNTSVINGTTGVPIPQVSGNRIVINTGNLNVRSGPSAGFSTVATVPGGSELAVIGRASDGVWYYVQGSFGTGWINSQFVLFRGDYGSVPIVNIGS